MIHVQLPMHWSALTISLHFSARGRQTPGETDPSHEQLPEHIFSVRIEQAVMAAAVHVAVLGFHMQLPVHSLAAVSEEHSTGASLHTTGYTVISGMHAGVLQLLTVNALQEPVVVHWPKFHVHLPTQLA